MGSKSLGFYLRTTNDFISAISTRTAYRIRESDFTRKRKLTFQLVVLCMLKLLRKNIQSELYSFFNDLNTGIRSASASAFVQNRKKIKPDLFYDLNRLIADTFYQDNDENVTLFEGMRLLSIDGSTIELPNTKKLLNQYGSYKNKNEGDLPMGRVSVLYDVLNNIVIDGLLRPYLEGEVIISREHYKHTKKGDLIIMDRGYPSFKSAWLLNQQGTDFLFRCQHNFSKIVKAFYDSGEVDQQVNIEPDKSASFKSQAFDRNSTLTVRLLRVELDNGEIEILMTSLIDKQKFPSSCFKTLYFKRWGIETFYNRFKNIIEVEKFSGKSHQFIQQEFNCALYMSNIQTIFTQEAQKEAALQYKHRTYEYKINQSMSLGLIRERLVQMHLKTNDTTILENELTQLLILNVVPIRPNRTNPRDSNKYRKRKKPKQFNNRRSP